MKKSTVFTTSLRVLILTLLLLAVLAPKKYSQTLMIIVAVSWLVIVLATTLYKNRDRLKKHFAFSAIESAHKVCIDSKDTQEEKSDTEPTPEAKPLTRIPSPAPSGVNEEVMLTHLALRISEKLKSAYPKATWEWHTAPDLTKLLSGQTVRIKVEEMDTYTHADITFDRYARIHVEPMILGTFTPAEQTPAAEPDTESAENEQPKVVDVTVWYELIGQKALENIITNLNTQGHSKLLIRENGEIVIKRQKKDSVQGTLDSFPGKNYWDELIQVFKDNELKARIAGECLEVSWL